MRILIACEFSGIVRNAFALQGHDVWSCDLLPTELPGNHIQGNVLDILHNDWDMMIAHPPCTYLCNSGVRWLHERKGRWDKMKDGVDFFRVLLTAPIYKIAIENPIPHKYALRVIGREYDQIIQPWQFGHGETKATCLWLKNLPRLLPTKIIRNREHRLHKLPPSKDRSKLRSKTYVGIAKAMADQWTHPLWT